MTLPPIKMMIKLLGGNEKLSNNFNGWTNEGKQ